MLFLNPKHKFMALAALTIAVLGIFLIARFYGGETERQQEALQFDSSRLHSRQAGQAAVFEFDDGAARAGGLILGEGYRRFTHPAYGFSVEYPAELEIDGYEEPDGGETVVFQRKGDDPEAPPSDKMGFQIFITPFGDDEVLTRERILEDLPGVAIEEPQEVILGAAVDGGADIRALLFWSEDPAAGRTREVWFVSGGNLYEITTYAHLDEWLANILSTWQEK